MKAPEMTVSVVDLTLREHTAIQVLAALNTCGVSDYRAAARCALAQADALIAVLDLEKKKSNRGAP